MRWFGHAAGTYTYLYLENLHMYVCMYLDVPLYASTHPIQVYDACLLKCAHLYIYIYIYIYRTSINAHIHACGQP